jgi:hypothetical protein
VIATACLSAERIVPVDARPSSPSLKGEQSIIPPLNWDKNFQKGCCFMVIWSIHEVCQANVTSPESSMQSTRASLIWPEWIRMDPEKQIGEQA